MILQSGLFYLRAIQGFHEPQSCGYLGDSMTRSIIIFDQHRNEVVQINIPESVLKTTHEFEFGDGAMYNPYAQIILENNFCFFIVRMIGEVRIYLLNYPWKFDHKKPNYIYHGNYYNIVDFSKTILKIQIDDKIKTLSVSSTYEDFIDMGEEKLNVSIFIDWVDSMSQKINSKSQKKSALRNVLIKKRIHLSKNLDGNPCLMITPDGIFSKKFSLSGYVLTRIYFSDPNCV